MPRIPDRWEVYSALGEAVGDTNFIPFKVPLKLDLCKRLPEVERFTPSHLLNMVERLRLVIDLTNTRRYYNPEDLTSNGVRYVKIFCQGHGQIPNHTTVSKFYDAVHHFLKEKKDGLIGVHCTHGLNRTGYLICRYMIEKLGYSAENAIKEFNTARGHDIERFEYLRDLYKIEETCRNATKGKNMEAKDHIGEGNSRNKADFDHSRNLQTNRRGNHEKRYHQSNVCYHTPPRFMHRQEENTIEGKSVGCYYNSWHNYGRRHYHELPCQTSFHVSPRYCYSFQAQFGNREHENEHNNYGRTTYFSQRPIRQAEFINQ